MKEVAMMNEWMMALMMRSYQQLMERVPVKNSQPAVAMYLLSPVRYQPTQTQTQ
jgi:hypothetical protein